MNNMIEVTSDGFARHINDLVDVTLDRQDEPEGTVIVEIPKVSLTFYRHILDALKAYGDKRTPLGHVTLRRSPTNEEDGG